MGVSLSLWSLKARLNGECFLKKVQSCSHLANSEIVINHIKITFCSSKPYCCKSWLVQVRYFHIVLLTSSASPMHCWHPLSSDSRLLVCCIFHIAVCMISWTISMNTHLIVTSLLLVPKLAFLIFNNSSRTPIASTYLLYMFGNFWR